MRRFGKRNGSLQIVQATCIAATGLLASGCDSLTNFGDKIGETNSYLNPSEPTLRPKHSAPLMRPIVSTLDPTIEEPNDQFPTAVDIEPDDLKPDEGDYRIGKNDLINIEIYDLLGEGTGPTVKTVRVTESGYVSLDFIKPVYALGLSEQELQDTIKQAYSDAGQIRNARVTVQVTEERARTFSAAGNVTLPGQYQILQNDFRVLDALITCHGPTEPEGVEYCYVIRKPQETPAKPPQSPATTEPSSSPSDLTPPTNAPPTTELLEPPHSEANPDNSPAATHLLSTSGVAADASPAADSTTTAPSNVSDEPNGLTGFKFNSPNPIEERIIRVPLRELRAGQLQFNIIIRPGDTIFVPDPPTGEYYMGGHVTRPGPYSLTARNITLKEAVIAAGMLDPVAIPGRTEIVRRIGQDKEVVVRVDLDKVMSLGQPDIFLKPYDEVFVGTNVWAPFLADFRNAFTLTYGLGFTYDRNYAPQNNGNNGGF